MFRSGGGASRKPPGGVFPAGGGNLRFVLRRSLIMAPNTVESDRYKIQIDKEAIAE